MPEAPDALADQVARLRDLVSHHKRALTYHRQELQKAATELARVEAAARTNGFGIVLVPPQTQKA